MFSDEIDAKYFVMVDGDDTYDVSKIYEVLLVMDKYNYDMMVGKRVHKDSSAYRKGHVIGNRFFSNFVNFFFGKDITDIFSGFRVFSKTINSYVFIVLALLDDLKKVQLRILFLISLKKGTLSL